MRTATVVCQLCEIGDHHGKSTSDAGDSIDCSNCGKFRISHQTFADFTNNIHRRGGSGAEQRALLAHLVRQRARPDEWIRVTPELVEQVYSGEASFPNAMAQVENLVLWLAENVAQPGEPVDIDYRTFQAVIGCTSLPTFTWVVRSAMSRDFLSGTESGAKGSWGLRHASLTLTGWLWYEQTGRHRRSRVAFMAMQYNDPILERLVDDHFRPAVAQAGFELRLLKDKPAAGVIDNRMRVEIRRSRIAVCDLTHGNKGAYWEAGFAEGLGLPVIYTCEESALKDAKLHFDTRNCQVVPWTVDQPQRAAAMLRDTIRNTLPTEASLDDPE